MRTGRLPTGGLAALAALLAALAVVVVAGAPAPRTILERVRVATTRPSASVVNRVHRNRSLQRVADIDGDPRRTTSEEATVPTHGPASTPTSSTTTTTTRAVTTTTRPVTTTTSPALVGAAGAPVSRDGTFAPGQTTVTAHLGAVRAVAVSVQAGLKVTLSVTCGLASRSATSVSTATVHIPDGAGACVATFAIPAGSPQPTTWQLVTG
jgi:hypothetical protein